MAVATNVELPTDIRTRKCASGTAIPLGTVMKLTTDNTVIASSADNDPFGGIAIEEKVAAETDVVTIGCAMDGDWDIDTTAAAITAGQMVNLSAANQVAAAVDGDLEQGSLVGKAITTRTGTNRIRVSLMGL